MRVFITSSIIDYENIIFDLVTNDVGININNFTFIYYFTSKVLNCIEIVLLKDAVITQLQPCVRLSGEVRYPELMFNQSLQIGWIGL